jgi:glycerol-3-phosphate dehydrogenase subunit C
VNMDKRIAYFAGCTANFVDPEVGEAAVQVLQRNGFQVVAPDLECCSIGRLSYGGRGTFLRRARANVRRLAEADCDVVTTCTSCALALKREYPRLLGTPEAERVAQRTYDIMEYLVRLRARGVLDTEFQPIRLHIAYHAPCHLKVLGQEAIDSRLELLRLIPGLIVTHIDKGCCGMGGTFGFKRSNYPSSMAIGQALFDAIREALPDMVVTECPGCKLQIEQGTGLSVSHPILIIKQAYAVQVCGLRGESPWLHYEERRRRLSICV